MSELASYFSEAFAGQKRVCILGVGTELCHDDAAGLFCAFGVPVMQMPTAFVLCLFFNGAKIPAMAATWVTNWVTAPIVFPAQIYIGSRIIRQELSWEKIKYTHNSKIRI
ncbi:MAG: DUF2062 domain-containing protein, partial [Clostridia bacterium]|nr:DUF2062 domain-containing protein [Clostridia bacterium]